MGFSKYHRSVKKHVVTAMLMLLAMAIMVLPAFANSRSWGFTGVADGNVVDGAHNGQFHNMTVGTMILRGAIWATNTNPGIPVIGWTFRVYKDNAFGVPDTLVCEKAGVFPSTTANQQVSFSRNCGSEVAGTYYLYIYRNNSDGRAVSGSGTLTTR